jgi:hypothetical protein
MVSGLTRNAGVYQASLYRLLKNSGFVSGHRFSDATNAEKPEAPSVAVGHNITFSAACGFEVPQ